MANFFNLFPKLRHSLSDKKFPDYQVVTDILFRTAFLKEALSNSSAYLEYAIRDGDTPEILATKVYEDPEAHWIILYANDILDPQFDWPLDTRSFYNYMVDKYRAPAEDDIGMPLEDYQVVSWTQDLTNPMSVHHYEKIIRRENVVEQTVSETRFVINKEKLTNNDLTVPYDYYDNSNLPLEQGVTPINLQIGDQTVIEKVYKKLVTYYDYELEKNEAKRNIKIVKKEYYAQIMREFEILTNNKRFPFIRNVA